MTGCETGVEAGYSGPYPSAAAQRALREIRGRTLAPEVLGSAFAVANGVELQIESFGVVPNPVTGKGPVVRLRESHRDVTPMDLGAEQGEDGVWFVPVLTDGDAADLVQRATGTAPVNFGGVTSAEYRNALSIETP